MYSSWFLSLLSIFTIFATGIFSGKIFDPWDVKNISPTSKLSLNFLDTDSIIPNFPFIYENWPYISFFDWTYKWKSF